MSSMLEHPTFDPTPAPPTEAVDLRRTLAEVRLQLQGERTARAHAEAAIRATDEFLAMLAHELRQPLAAALTAIELQKHSAGNRLKHTQDVLAQQVTYIT